MAKIKAIVYKDWLLIARDRIGLLILFVLPVCLVIVMSLMQSKLEQSNQVLNVALLVTEQTPPVKALESVYKKTKYFKLDIYRKPQDLNLLKQQVKNSQYQALIVLGKRGSGDKDSIFALYVDPTTPSNVAHSIKLVNQLILSQAQLKMVQKIVNPQYKKQIQGIARELHFEQQFVAAKQLKTKPSTAQQNVPAWTLFGMFFIVVPLASQMLIERNECIQSRLVLTPVKPIYFVLGRMLAYLALNLAQLILMLMIGVYGLPVLGITGLDLHDALLPLVLISFCVSLSATGFGIFIGTWCKTQQQISSIAPFLIVIMAAISGIFVPSYLMPDSLLYLSQVSPLYWSQQSFLDVLVRGQGVLIIYPNLLKLLLFSIVMLAATAVHPWFKKIIKN